MTRFSMPFIVLAILSFPLSFSVGEIIPELVMNYSDFSYISSVAVGYKYVYFGTTNGITRYDVNRQEWDDPMPEMAELHNQVIREIEASYDDESVWIRTDMGIFEYSRTLERWQQIPEMPSIDSRTRHLKTDELFFAPWGYNYLPEGVLVDDYGRKFPLTDIVDDTWANLWIGTWGLGAAHSDAAGYRIELLEYGLLQENVSTVHVNDGILWIGGKVMQSYRTGVTVFDWSNNSFGYIESHGSLISRAEDINDITGNDRDVFVATDDGVWVVDRESKKVRDRLSRKSGLPDNRVFSVLVSGDSLFVGTEYGVGILRIYTDSLLQISETLLPSHAVLSLEKAGRDLWIGTSRGVYRLDFENRKLGFLSAPEVTRSGNVYDIEFAGDKIWLATEHELVSIDINDAGIEIFPEVNSYGGAHAVAVRDTIVAVAAESGLLLIYNGQKPYHELFTSGDGLLSNYINDLVFDGEYIWLGTDKGLTRFWYLNPSIQ
jgi:ligand-binding sensor domain-containing protein